MPGLSLDTSLASGCVSVTAEKTISKYIANMMRTAYTEFEYSDIAIDAGAIASGPATGETIPGGPSGLFSSVATITATITNTGSVSGAEVAQLYLSYPSSAPPTPPLQLRGFDKLSLGAGESGPVTFELRWRDLSYWDEGEGSWVVPSGAFGVNVGASSRDIRLEGTINV